MDLFKVVNVKTGKTVECETDLYSKRLAKSFRDMLNEEAKSKAAFKVSYGPDHWKV